MSWHKFILVLLFCLYSSLCSAGWTTSTPNLISPSTYTFTYASVFSSCDSTTNTQLATWADGNNNQYPTYSFYTTGAGWSPINTITTSSGALITTNVLSSCDPSSGIFFATWTDSSTHQPTSSVYVPGMGWSTIDPLTAASASTNTANTFDSTAGQFLVTWADTTTHFPTYSFYTPGTGWGSVEPITTVSLAANVYTTFDSIHNRFLAVWVDIGTGQPFYSFYSSGAWSNAALLSASASVDNDVLCAYNPFTNQFFATWADINQNLYPFYSIYTQGDGWSPAETITTSSGVTDNVTISCDPLTGESLAAWSNVSSGIPTYSFYTSAAGWSEPAVISNLSKTGSDIFTCFSSSTRKFLATWADTSNPDLIFDPTYSFFTFIAPPPPPPPPKPIIASIFPRSSPRTCGINTYVWIYGENFSEATKVFFGLDPVNFFSVVSDTKILALVPQGHGTVDVRVFSPGGISRTTPNDQFTYLLPPPSNLEGKQCHKHRIPRNIIKWDPPPQTHPAA